MSTADEFIAMLDQLDGAKDAVPILEICDLNLTTSKFKKESKDTKYIKTLLYTCDKYDIYLIEWGKHASTEFHDHASRGCAMKVLRGTLLEQKISFAAGKTNTILFTNNVSYIDDEIGFHKIKTIGNETALSLHVYFPSNHQTTYFSST